MFRLADKKQRFPTWRYTVLSAVCIVALVGVVCQLEPWVIWQRMVVASLVVGFTTLIVNFWFSSLFR